MTLQAAMLAALLAGFFGSTHCFGMCGAIVLLFEAPAGAGSRLNIWLRRVLYNAGRLGFYVLLGVVAGLGGAVLNKLSGVSLGLQVLRVLAAVLVMAIGMNLLFNWRLTRFLETAGAGLWRRLSGFAKYVLPADTALRALSAGFLWGALPCGLVYSAVAMAATTGNPYSGGSVMFAFWLGTAPALIAAGASTARLKQVRANTTLRRAAGLTIVLLGLLALMPFAAQQGHHHAGRIPDHNLIFRNGSTTLVATNVRNARQKTC